MTQNQEKVLEALKNAGKPLRPGDIVEMTGIDSKEVSKALKFMKDAGTICSPKRCFYAPSE
jgi:DNA-binding MarR family transcriptional regulator